ncbi:MAG: efflux RND transporter periplasmic adaptor subunit [Deltaproteobacteria bacterium]|nr:efflux RND transporter periplasmic adaptor subunit [Deltaproteobacteria bacterium]
MKPSTIAKAVLPLIFLALGIGVLRGLIASKTKAEKAPPEARISAVEFVEVHAGAPVARIDSTGIVEGDKQVALSALVSGEVVWVAKDLDPGARFRAGASLLRVDPRDYEIAVAQEGSRVQQSQLELELETQRQQTAAREWELLGGGKDPSSSPLALRKPQFEVAQRQVESAQSGLKRAELNLERTTLKAPFNAMVLSETVEKGQLLSPGAQVVTLVGTDRFRVKVSIPVDKLGSLAIPGVNGSAGSTADVVQDIGGGSTITRKGRITGLAGQLDPQTRTADLYIAVDKPLEGEGLPMLPGAFVTVSIEGLPVDGAIAIPRDALVGGDNVWTVTSDSTLQSRAVTIAWRDGNEAFVTSGLESGARVVVTPPSLPVEGAKVRPVRKDAPSTAESTPAPSGSEG